MIMYLAAVKYLLNLLANSPTHCPHHIVLHPTSLPRSRFQRRYKCVLFRSR